MKNCLYLILLITSVLVVFSCHKDDDVVSIENIIVGHRSYRSAEFLTPQDLNNDQVFNTDVNKEEECFELRYDFYEDGTFKEWITYNYAFPEVEGVLHCMNNIYLGEWSVEDNKLRLQYKYEYYFDLETTVEIPNYVILANFQKNYPKDYTMTRDITLKSKTLPVKIIFK